MTLTQFTEPGRVIGWINFSHWQIVHGFCGTFHELFTVIRLLFILLVWVGTKFLSICV